MIRPSPGPSWTVLPEPPSTSPTPTTRSDANHGDDDDDINLNPPPAKRKAVQSPISISVPRPSKVARLNDHDQRERPEKRAQPSSDRWTNVAAPSSLTQAPNVAKKNRPSFLTQPTSVPPVRPAKGKNRVSSRQSTSSLSDHISNMVEKHNRRYRRVETARKTTRKRRVTTAGLMRDVQRSSSGSEVSSAATRVRRASDRVLPRARPFFGGDVIELTDSSDSTRRNRACNDEPIIILSSDADTPQRQPKPSQKSNSRNTGPRRPPPTEAEVICISDSDDDTVPTPLPATATPAIPQVAAILAPSPATTVPPDRESLLSPPGAVESDDNDGLFDNEPPYLAPDDVQALANSELQQQTEELFSYINLDPPEQDHEIASPSAQEESNVAQDLPLPSSDSPPDYHLSVSKQATETSANDVVPVKVTTQLSGSDNHAHLELLVGSQPSTGTQHPPSQLLSPTVLTNKPSVAWKYTPPSTNPFFARTLSFNAKVLNKSLPVTQTSTEPTVSTSPVAVVASPAASSTNLSPKPLVDEQPSDAHRENSSAVISRSPSTSPSSDDDGSVSPAASSTNLSPKLLVDEQPPDAHTENSSAVMSRSPATSSSEDDDGSVLPAVDNIRDSPSMDVTISRSDIPVPAAAAPSSATIPVPPRVQRSTTNLTLTELLNRTREEHLKSCFIDLTDEVSPSSGEGLATGMFTSKHHKPVQPLHPTFPDAAGSVSASHPAPSPKTSTPNIQEIRNLVRRHPSSSKLSTSLAATNPSTSSVVTDPSASSIATDPSFSSITSAASPFTPSQSPPRSFISNPTTSITHSGSKPNSRRKNRPMGVATLEMYISPIAGASQPVSSSTPRCIKRMSYGADRFRSIITPTADTSARSQSLSPSEGRRPKRAVVSHGLHAGAGADAASGVLSSPSAKIRVPFNAPPERATPTTSPSAIPLNQETAAQKVGVEVRHTHEGISPREDILDGIVQPEGIQGVTESIGSLDLRGDSRSSEGDIDVDQVHRLSLQNGYEDGVQAIPVSAELMEHEEHESLKIIDYVSTETMAEAPAFLGKYRDVDEEDGDVAIPSSAQGTSGTSDVLEEASEQEECLAVLMQLEVSDREAGDVEHPTSISSSRTASSHASSRQTLESLQSAEPSNVVGSGVAASNQQLEDGVESYMGGYPIVTWKSYSDAQRRLPPKYNLAKDLPHELQDRVNALPQSYRNSDQARLLFEAMIDEAMDDDLNAPPVSVINDVTDEGAPPWEFVYTNQMWYNEGVPPPDVKNLKSCDCVGRCDPKSCSCAKRQRRHLRDYIEDGTIPKTWNGAPFMYDGKGCLQFFGLPIFECNAFCGCDEDCPNRVVQNGRKYVVNIKKTENKGWGVFNGPKKIAKGSFIGVYAGELLTVGEADHRGVLYNKFGRTYLFDIDFHHMGSKAVYSVDAYHAGNLTRFLNHSCDPNCEIQACYINDANLDKPMLTVFTMREVEPFEELCFSYMGQIDDDTLNAPQVSNDAVFGKCHCGSANCVGVLFSGL